MDDLLSGIAMVQPGALKDMFGSCSIPLILKNAEDSCL